MFDKMFQNKNSAWDISLYWLLVAFLLLPIWLFNYFPTVDGPVHAYNADLIVKLLSGGWINQAHFFEINQRLDPNWFVHSFFAVATYLVGAFTAEKLLLTVYVLAFSAGWIYAIKSLNPDSWQLAFLGLPLICNFALHFGFYSFVLSLAVTLFVFGYWFRHNENFTVKRAVGFGALLILLYLTHVVSYVATLLGIGVLIASQWLASLVQQRRNKRFDITWFITDIRQRLLPFTFSVLPSFILFLTFFLPRDVIVEPSNGPLLRLGHLFLLTQLVSFDYLALVLSVGLGVVIFGSIFWIGLQRWRTGKTGMNDLLLFVLLAEVLLYMVTPDTLVVTPGGLPGGGLMQLRLSFYPVFIAIFWLTTLKFRRQTLQLFQLVGIVATLGFSFLHISSYTTINQYLTEYIAIADKIESDAIYLPLRLNEVKQEPDGHFISRRLDPFTHTGSYVSLQKDLTNLQNIEAMYGYFPLRFKSITNPYSVMGRLDIPTPRLNLQEYEKAVGREVDYISIWGLDDTKLSQEQRDLYQQVQVEYERIYQSDNKLIELYKKIDS